MNPLIGMAAKQAIMNISLNSFMPSPILSQSHCV